MTQFYCMWHISKTLPKTKREGIKEGGEEVVRGEGEREREREGERERETKTERNEAIWEWDKDDLNLISIYHR
jgi:hypothetical protein